MNEVNNEQEYMEEKIRTQYTEKQHTELDELRALDRKVKAPATTFAYGFGTISALVMGSGMSLIMTDFGAVLGKTAFPVGIVAGVIGLVLVALAYPVYNRELKKQREKAAPEILRLTDALMK